MSALPPWEDPRRVLSRHGLVPKRGYSQNFLVSRSAVERIAEAAAGSPSTTTVELGPGLGTLTGALLRSGARVVAFEQDRDMLRVLEEEFGECSELQVRHGDAAKVDFSKVALETGGPITVVGNLPYAITGGILRNLSVHRTSLNSAVIMIQREVRDRLLASAGSKTYGALTVFVQAGFSVSSVLRVPAGAFFPAPKVESAVVRLTPLPKVYSEETVAFRTVVKAAFGKRRKTLRNALRALGLEHVDRALADAAIDGGRRGETLSVQEFANLGRAWEATTG